MIHVDIGKGYIFLPSPVTVVGQFWSGFSDWTWSFQRTRGGVHAGFKHT